MLISSESLVTLVICCFREGDLLRECWESVLNQTDDRWQAILVMDGGADEKTKKIFNELTCPKLEKLELQNNIGPYPARNRAIAMADTKYVFHVDADDMIPPDCVKNLRSGFKSNVDYVYGPIQYIGLKKHIVSYPKPLQKRKLYIAIFPITFAHTKKMWEEIGGYTDELATGGADLDFYIAILEGKYRGIYLDKIIYFYRIHSSSQVSKMGDNYYLKRKIIVKRHPNFFKNWLFKVRFIGYGALEDAEKYALNGEVNKAKKRARISLRFCCLDRPIAWYIAFFGKLNEDGKFYNFLKKLYAATLKKIIIRIDI